MIDHDLDAGVAARHVADLTDLMRREKDVEHRAQFLGLLPERVAHRIVEPDVVAVVDGAEPQANQMLLFHGAFESRGVLGVGGGVQAVAHQQPDTGETVGVGADTVAGVGVVGAVVADVADHDLVDAVSFHLGQQMLAGVLPVGQGIGAVGETRVGSESGVVDHPGVLGIHLEGPYLNAARKGVHDPSKFHTPGADELDVVTGLGKEGVTLLTLAPERFDDSASEEVEPARNFVDHRALDGRVGRGERSKGRHQRRPHELGLLGTQRRQQRHGQLRIRISLEPTVRNLAHPIIAVANEFAHQVANSGQLGIAKRLAAEAAQNEAAASEALARDLQRASLEALKTLPGSADNPLNTGRWESEV